MSNKLTEEEMEFLRRINPSFLEEMKDRIIKSSDRNKECAKKWKLRNRGKTRTWSQEYYFQNLKIAKLHILEKEKNIFLLFTLPTLRNVSD